MDGEPIYNGTTEHAQIVIETLFRVAKNKINVLSEALNDSVFGDEDTIEVAEKYIRHLKRPVKIIVEREPEGGWASNKFFRAFANLPNVEVKILDVQNAPKFDFHFTTADGNSFRFEPDKSDHSAVASFGNPKTTSNLDSIFDDLWKFGQAIALPPVEATA